MDFDRAINYLDRCRQWNIPLDINVSEEIPVDRVGKCLCIVPGNKNPYDVRTFSIPSMGIFKDDDGNPIHFRARCVRKQSGGIIVRVVSQNKVALHLENREYTIEELPARKRLKRITR